MKKDSIEQIAMMGDDLETLKALRQKLAASIDKSESGRDISSLSRQLQIVMNQISELEGQKKSSAELSIDEIVRNSVMPPVRTDRRRADFYSTDDDEYTDEE